MHCGDWKDNRNAVLLPVRMSRERQLTKIDSQVQWFDRLYNSKVALDTFKAIETTFILDEPTYFARFTERWIRTEPLANNFVIRRTDPNVRRLAGKQPDDRGGTFYAEFSL